MFKSFSFSVLSFFILLMPLKGSMLYNNEKGDLVESLKEIADSEDIHDTVRINAIVELCRAIRSSEPDVALSYGKKAINLAQNKDIEIYKADALNTVGIIYWQMGELGRAMDYMLEARQIYVKTNNQMGIARIMLNLGLIYHDRAHYEKALEYYFEALRIFQELDFKSGQATAYNNIGRLYWERGDIDLSERYHLLSLELRRELDELKGESYSYNNLGVVYKSQGRLDEAIEFFIIALTIREELGDKREMAATLINLGNLYILKENSNEGFDCLYKALALFEEVNDQSGISRNLFYLGSAYFVMNNLAKAEDLFYLSLDMAKKTGLTKVITDNYDGLAKVNARRNNYQKAYNYQKMFKDIKDSIYSEESRLRIYEFQMLFDSERKEREIELFRRASQINELNYEKQRLLKNFLLAGIVLVVLLLFLLYNRFLVINKTNKLLEKRRDEITKSNAKLVKLNHILLEQKKKLDDLNKRLNNTNQKLTESEKELIEANASKDKLFSIISHDLRNPFASIVSFSRMLKRDLDNLDKEELKELSHELDKTVVNINDLLENLLQWSRTQIGRIKYNPQYLDFAEIVKDNISLFMPNAEEKQITIDNKINSNAILWADQNMTDTVIRNLLSNAIKFSKKKGKIQLYYETDNDYAYISIKDNGVGISAADQEMLFRKDSLFSTFGTFDEKGSGLGLLLCKEFVEKQHGEIKFESTEGKGSVFTISLPLSEIS